MQDVGALDVTNRLNGADALAMNNRSVSLPFL
jgi:hypothetical protein